MGLFQHKVKSSIKEHIKGIFNRNPIPRKENVMSQFSEDTYRATSLELKGQKYPGRSYGNCIQYLMTKGWFESNQSNENIVKYAEKAPEFGDSKVNSHPPKYNFAPTYRSTVDIDGRNSSTVSHNDTISYSKDNHRADRHCMNSTGNRAHDARKRSASSKSDGSVDKYNERFKINYSRSRQYAKFHNKRYETKIDNSNRSIRNSSSTGVESRRNPGSKSELTKASTKYAQGQNKTLLTNTLCPQKRHEILSSDKPCACMKVEKMKTLQAGRVYYEWHKVEAKAVDGKIIKKLESSPSLDEFKLMSPIKVSTGGQGTVAWVHLPKTTKQYALKYKLRQDKNDKTWTIERREAKLLQKVKHSFIVDTYHIYETDSALFMAFEYLSGGCLWHHIARIGVLPEGYAVYYAACILTALSYLHDRGVVYR
nr:hypothetical transcript [Hymenolepis microstoma]